MSRFLTPAEIEALRAVEPFVPAPAETFRVSVEIGTAEITPASVASLEPGSVLPLEAAKPGLAEIVANGVVVAYGRVEEREGVLAVRIVQLAKSRGGIR